VECPAWPATDLWISASSQSGCGNASEERARDWLATLLRHVCCDRAADRVEASTRKTPVGGPGSMRRRALEQGVELIHSSSSIHASGVEKLPVRLDLERPPRQTGRARRGTRLTAAKWVSPASAAMQR